VAEIPLPESVAKDDLLATDRRGQPKKYNGSLRSGTNSTPDPSGVLITG
jgi:hypothetical protein